MLNRRHFLRNLGLSGTLIVAPVALIEAATLPLPAKPTDLTTVTLKGNISAGGNPVAGVAVTDGINITLTDKRGNYELLSNHTADYVYISSPAGYQFNQKRGIASFYKAIPKDSTSFKADFVLEKLNVSDQKHNFLVWADPQIISKKDAALLKAQTVPDVQELVKSYPQGTLFHGIGCGDLVWDHFELIADYKDAVAETGIPFFNLPGNHDMDLDARSDELSTRTFKDEFGPTYYSYNRGEIHYISLDNVFFLGVAKKYIGYLTETQLQWIEQDLKTVKPGSTVVVSVHIPTNTGNSRRNKLKDDELGGVLSNRERLYKLLEGYQVHILSGHTHMNEKWEDRNMIEHVHGTVCGAWWTGPVCSDGCPNGYGVYEVTGSEIKWYYKSTGKAKDHQLRIYPKGSFSEIASVAASGNLQETTPATSAEIGVNIWNWDPKWKVEYFEDGVNKGAMKQRTAMDPIAYQLYDGPLVPKKHKWVEPTLTDHLFFATPAPGTRQFKVVATDRFGSVYTEEITVS